MNEFVKRVITYVVAVFFLLSLLWFRGVYFIVMFTCFACIAQYELQHALFVQGMRPVRSLGYVLAAGIAPVYVLLGYEYTIALFLLCVMLSNMAFLLIRDTDARQRTFADMAATTFLLIYPTVPFFTLIPLVTADGAAGVTLLCMAFSLGFLSDTFGYIIGMPFGKHKLAPMISPSKSVEGAVAGCVAASLGAVVIGIIASTQGVSIPLYAYALVGLLASVAGQAGDLFASAIKRYCGIKDFGSLFPGHGGVIDRLDGVFFTAVVVYAASLFIL